MNSTELADLISSPEFQDCSIEGPCEKCHYSLGLPAYLPRIIGCGLAALIAIIVFILYLVEERRKEKVFYTNSKKVNENEQEKNDRDAIAFGVNNASYVVEQSTCTTPNVYGGGFKVLEKKPKRKFAVAPPITPFSTNVVSKHSRVKTARKEEKEVFQVTVIADKLGRGSELVSLVNETEIPVGHTTNDEKATFAVETIKTHLEKMTEEKWVIYGYLEEKNWIYAGSEHMLGEFSELRLELKLSLTSPINLLVTAFLVKGDGTPPIAPPKIENREMEKPPSPPRNSVKKAVANLIKSTKEEKPKESSESKIEKKRLKSKEEKRDKEKEREREKEKESTSKIQKTSGALKKGSPLLCSPNSSNLTKVSETVNPTVLKKKIKELKRDDESKQSTNKPEKSGSISGNAPAP
ncbi:unnamed protein product [Caenorhabditis angaria]|uniref:Uncharacterized protein n=1 Tax=Caenorhabditis angaria TaxID=860376 RepID=A0A9P1MXE4_9PELO|nr:unnamed protein product [Caenorhabditis angaria]